VNANVEMRQLLEKLPLEEQMDRVLDDLEERVERHPLTQRLQRLYSQIPYVPAQDVPTPLGRIRTPELKAPEPVPPKVDERRRAAVKAAVAIDISSVVAAVPVVGDAVADVVEDIYAVRLKETLTPRELTDYMKFDKVGPSTVAVLRAFMKR